MDKIYEHDYNFPKFYTQENGTKYVSAQDQDRTAEIIFKQGGQLKLIPRAKSGIHIKKKNKGKFTEYCGGKVTDECIQKAKKSSNPTLRKRATFAESSRKWHKK